MLSQEIQKAQPPYIAILSLFSFGGRLGPTLASVVLAAFVFIMMLLLSLLDPGLQNVWSLIDLPFLIAATIRLTSAGYFAVLREASAIESLLVEVPQRDCVRQVLVDMFRARLQMVSSWFFSLLMVGSLIVLRELVGLPTVFQQLGTIAFYSGLIGVFVAGFFGGWGFWLVTSMVRFILVLGRLPALRLDNLSPHSTVGLQRVQSLVRLFAVCYSVGVVAIGMPILFLEWSAHSLLVRIITVYLWPVLFGVGLLVFLLILPRVVFSHHVRLKRDASLTKLQDQIERIMSSHLSEADTDELVKLGKLQTQLLGARLSLLDPGGLITWVSSLGIQLPFVVQWFDRVGLDWKSFISRVASSITG
ncbi:MAG: hypothetical protein AB1792_05025 [Candidatus Zixiibacteriota bacterium]